MAYDTPKAAHIRAEIGGKSEEHRQRLLSARWTVARHLESNGVLNLLNESDRRKAKTLLRTLPPEMTNYGQIDFYLTGYQSADSELTSI